MCRLGECSEGGFLTQDGGMKGQRWHSLAQEWKTFSPENREATTGRGSAERPWVSMDPFGEVTCLEMQRRPPEPSEALFIW